MKRQNGYTIIEISIIAILISIILSLTINIKSTRDVNKIKKSISTIDNYTKSINNFKKKYGFLPGDLKKTQIFDLSRDNTDGNENNLIEDKNQKNLIKEKNIKADGEIFNFWLHLYKSGFVKEAKQIFPYIDFLKSGILVFSMNDQNYYHFSIHGVNKNKEIQTKNNLTPYHSYLIDKKLDDGLPFSGLIEVTNGNKIQISSKNQKNINKKCATSKEYLTIFRKKTCQLIMRIDI